MMKNSCYSTDKNDEIHTGKKLKTDLPCNLMSSNRISSPNYQQKQNDLLQNNQFESFSPLSSPSPILGGYLLESNSPILGLRPFMTTSNSPILSHVPIRREGSPILTNIAILNEVRMKRRARKLKIEQSPPLDSIEPLSSMIKESDSPIYSRNDSITIDTFCSQEQMSDNSSENQLTKIESICSQDELSIVDDCSKELTTIVPICSQDDSTSSISTTDASENSSGSSNASQCYHQPKIRKKHCKPGGLLHQIQKTIHLQASRMSLWHHDMHWKKINPSELDYIQCYVQNHWKEYGCHIFQCSDVNDKEQFLVCLGHNTTAALFEVEFVRVMKIYPPFREKRIEYNNKDFKLYYNITRIILQNIR